MKELFIIHWGRAAIDEDGNPDAFCRVFNTAEDEETATKMLTECKDQLLNEILVQPDYDEEDMQQLKDSIHVYGSEREQYYEIDFMENDTACEFYITMQTI